MVSRILLLTLICFSLSACSSGDDPVEPTYCISSCESEDTTEDEETSVTLSTSGGYSSGVDSVDYNAASGVFTLTTPSLDVQMARFSNADYGAMLAMRDATSLHNAYFGQGQGSDVVVYSGGVVGSEESFGSYVRSGATELPLTGSARFTGEYAGFTSTRRINGDARLDVDFGEATVSGRITNRVFRQRNDNAADVVNPLSMIILEETNLTADGKFRGVTGGGQIVNGQLLWNPASGRFEGLIGGANAEEAVGIVTLTHRAPSGLTFEETGGFLATR